MKAIIVDDEPKAIELLKGYLEHFSAVELVGTFRNGLKAFEFLNQYLVDVAFLDINMPHLSGTSLAKMTNTQTKIVFTTAYSEFAVESYELDAADYLLKPVSFERFAKTVSKLLNQSNQVQSVPNDTYILIKSGSKTVKVKPQEILFLQKDSNYMVYHLADQRVMARESVQEALAHLADHFIQVHKSFIVNLHAIDSFEKDEIEIGKHRIPISGTFRNTFFERMKNLGAEN
ncbi:MAG: response regulator transcription factor [Cyclobacteriaceae bacterium]|nr:response regulator transcription factor [Cyclobacteriaceae bacterium]